jgi:hypothetical protein
VLIVDNLKSFRMNAYEKPGGGLIAKQLSEEDGCPEEHRDEGSLYISNEGFVSRPTIGREGPLFPLDEGTPRG